MLNNAEFPFVNFPEHDALRAELLQMLQPVRQPGFTVLRSATGAGKTALCGWLRDQAKTPYEVLTLHFGVRVGPEGILFEVQSRLDEPSISSAESLAENLNGPMVPIEEMLPRVAEALARAGTRVIIFDDADSCFHTAPAPVLRGSASILRALVAACNVSILLTAQQNTLGFQEFAASLGASDRVIPKVGDSPALRHWLRSIEQSVRARSRHFLADFANEDEPRVTSPDTGEGALSGAFGDDFFARLRTMDIERFGRVALSETLDDDALAPLLVGSQRGLLFFIASAAEAAISGDLHLPGTLRTTGDKLDPIPNGLSERVSLIAHDRQAQEFLDIVDGGTSK